MAARIARAFAQMKPATASGVGEYSLGFQSNVSLSSYFLVVATAALVLPTSASLAQSYWGTSDGAHGPIIFFSGVWLIYREREHLIFRGGEISHFWLTCLLPPLLVLYAFARPHGMIRTEFVALYLLLILLGFYYFGPSAMRRLRFAIVYLAFLIEPPFDLVVEWTQSLQIALSGVSVALLHQLNYPIGGSGVLIQIGQYELLVKQACAGVASMVTLFALGLLYVHLTQPARRTHAAILFLAIIPIALVANLLRVVILVLLTYHFGNAVAQSFLHDLAGVTTFALSMLGMLAMDHLLAASLQKA